MARHSKYKVSKLVLIGAAAPSFTLIDHNPYGIKKEAVNDTLALTYVDRPMMLAALVQLYKQIKESRFIVIDYAVKPNNLLINLTSERADECLYSTCPFLILFRFRDKISYTEEFVIPMFLINDAVNARISQ